MQGPYGLELTESCRTCKLRANGFFCQLSPVALKHLEDVRFSSLYPKGAVLFLEKQNPRGMYILCEGEVKLSVSSRDGKTLILRIAKPGEALGLMSALTGSPYEATAETLRPCQVAFVRREELPRFLEKYPEAYQNVARQLAAQYQSACEQLRTLGLSASVQAKLAKLLLDWSVNGREARDGTRIKMPLTHEEIAECIGTTRESVTRTLSDFKHRQLVELHGSTLTIPDRAALQMLVAA